MLQKISIGIVLFLLFFLPFVVFPFGPSFFETPKILVAEIGIGILCLLSIATSTISFSKMVFFFFTTYTPFLLLLLLTIANLISFNSHLTFFGNSFRLQGVLLLWLLVSFSLAASHFRLPSKLTTIASGSALLLLVVCLALFGKNETGRYLGPLGEPNALAAVIIFFYPFVTLSQTLERKIKWILGGIACSMLLLTVSRSGIIAFALENIFLMCYVWQKNHLAAMTTLLLVLSLGSLFLPFFDTPRTYESRSEVWQTAYMAGWKSPIWGQGFGNVETVLHTESIRLSNNVRFQYIDSSHNIVLDWWVQGGLVGVGILLWVFFTSIRTFLKKGWYPELMALVGIWSVLLFNPADVVTLVQAWWLMGQGLL